MKAPPINVAEEEQKGLQKIGLPKRSTKKFANKSPRKKHILKNIRQQSLGLQKIIPREGLSQRVT